MLERTLFIIKPDAVGNNQIGAILQAVEDAGLRIVALQKRVLNRPQAEGFYAVHRERPFFGSLCEFMTSGPIVVGVLEGENAIRSYRELMGATDSHKADKGTIRQRFGTDVERNAVHGSDGPETATFEISYFFPGALLRGL